MSTLSEGQTDNAEDEGEEGTQYGRDVEGEVAQDHKESGGDEGLHDVVANVPGQGDLHDDAGVADVVDVRAVVIVKIYTVVELVQSDVRVHLENNISCTATLWASPSPETWTC